MIEKIENKDYIVEFNFDFNVISPRKDENYTKMVCFHRKFDLGDKHDYNKENYCSWDELKDDIIKNEHPLVIQPIYLYEHSGITISTSPFPCKFDSGQIGWVYVILESNFEESHDPEIHNILLQDAIFSIKREIETYDLYLRGEVYKFTIYEKCPTCGHKIREVYSEGEFYGEEDVFEMANLKLRYLMDRDDEKEENGDTTIS